MNKGLDSYGEQFIADPLMSPLDSSKDAKPSTSSKTVFLTGATGVVGQALQEKLRNNAVICLMHRSPVTGPNIVSLPGDISQPRFGLSAAEFHDLAKRIDCIIHSAAITDFSLPDKVIFRTNVDGTENALELAAAARVPLYYISTAFTHPRNRTIGNVEPNAYEISKREAERIVQDSGLPNIILRPSVVVGHSQTGAIGKFQGLHRILGLYLKGLLPIIPASPQAYIDFVPQDVVAAIVAALIKQDSVSGNYWLTAGSKALTLENLIDLCTENAPRLVGRTLARPRVVTPDVFERLIRPVFLPALPARMQQTIDRAIQFSRYMMIEEALPSSFPDLQHHLNLPPPPSLELTLLRNIEYWATTNRYSVRSA